MSETAINLANLHRIQQNNSDNLASLLNQVKSKFNQFQDISSKISNFFGSIEEESKSGFQRVKRQITARLEKQRKKYRLALESLGWGTLADLLDAALCGKVLNVTV
jgi:DNA anti-recombination protein RmuC